MDAVHALCTFVCLREKLPWYHGDHGTRWTICYQDLDCKDGVSHAQEPNTQNHYLWLMNRFIHSRCLQRVSENHVWECLHFNVWWVNHFTLVEWVKPLLCMHRHIHYAKPYKKKVSVNYPKDWNLMYWLVCACRRSEVTISHHWAGHCS